MVDGQSPPSSPTSVLSHDSILASSEAPRRPGDAILAAVDTPHEQKGAERNRPPGLDYRRATTSRPRELRYGAALALAVAFVLPRNSSAASRGTVTDLPGGVTLFAGRSISTFTNLENPENQFTDVGGGSAIARKLENGDLLVVARGHTGLVVPGEGIFQIIGRVKITLSPPYDIGSELTVLENQGRLIDVCARLA